MTSDLKPVKWGILGAARIAEGAILPAIAKSPASTAWAIAARDPARARAMADRHGAAMAYGSYEALLTDREVEAVYIALPNHLHVEWARKAAVAGKHVLIEKPAALRAADLEALADVDPSLKIAEAFMVRHQPRWQHLRRMLAARNHGAALTFSSLLSFHMTNERDFRQTPEWGGGAFYDLGCYTAMAARFVFGVEPLRAMAQMQRNAAGIDLFTSVILDFGAGRQATFMVSLAQASSQSIEIVCERAFLTLPQAYVPSRTEPNHIVIDTSTDHSRSEARSVEFPALDQYEVEVTNFALAVRGRDVPFYGLDDARANAAVADAVFRSATTGTWVEIGEV